MEENKEEKKETLEVEKTPVEHPPAAEPAPAEQPPEADEEQKPAKRPGVCRRVLKIFCWVLVAVLVLLLAHPLWIGSAGRMASTSLTPSYTGTEFGLKDLSVNGFSGKVAFNELRLGNPAGAPEKLPDAVSVKSFFLDVAPGSLVSDEIHVREIKIESPYASLSCIDGLNNFAVIGENVKKKLGPEKKKEEKKSDTKAVVDHLLITDVRVDLGLKSAVTIPKIELTTVTNVATLVVENFRIANPVEESEVTNAVYVSRLTVTLDWASVFTKKIHIYDITVEDPYVSAYFSKMSFDHFNLSRVFADIVPPKDEKKADDKKDGKAEGKDAAAKDDAVKIEIDRLVLERTGCRLLGTELGLVIPKRIELNDIGKSEKGVKAEEVVEEELWPRLKEKLGDGFNASWATFVSTYEMLKKGAGAVVDGAKKAAEVVGEGAKKTAEAVGEGAKKTAEVVGDGAKAVGEGAKKTVEVVGDGAKAVGEGAKKTVDAVGEGAKKGLDAVKKLNPFGN